MSMSYYDLAAKRHLDELVEEHPETLSVAYDALHKLKNNFFPKDIVAALGQPYRPISMAEALSFAYLWRDICLGNLAACRIDLGIGPLKDKFIEDNNERLQRAKKCINCDIVFWGGLDDDDGFVSILDPIVLATMNTPRREITYGGGVSQTFPLEVGHQSFNKTHLTLTSHGLLARWPYGSRYLWLIKRTDESLDLLNAKFFALLFNTAPAAK